jgi:hypothetical protein
LHYKLQDLILNLKTHITMKRHIRLIFTLLTLLSLTARSQDAPVTYAPFISNAISGNVVAGITVEDFTAIGAINLELRYNPLVLTYVGASPNVAFNPALFTVTSASVSPGINKISIAYPHTGSGVTLTDGSTMVALTFTFTDENEINHSTLSWYDDGSSCQYRDASNNILNDSPTADFYIDGLIASQVAPVSYLPYLDFYTGGPFELPITVDNFNSIGSISLTFEYDPAVIDFDDTYTPAAPFGSMTASDQASTGGKRKVVIGWFGTPATLANGSTIVSIDFTYIAGTTSLTWLDEGITCEYGDANSYPLYDSPTSTYYKHGEIIPTPAPRIKADTVAGTSGKMITVPLTVWGFENINSMDLALDFTASVLSFDCATLHPDLPGELVADNSMSGRLLLSWTSVTEQTLPDAAKIIYLSFLYNGGTTALTWDNSGASCQFTTGASHIPLTDLPTNEFYFNGQVTGSTGPVLWTGATSTNWNTASNWQSAQVPDSFFDVMITSLPSPPPNWPAFTGDFSVGDQCRNLTLEGAAELTVTGYLAIEPGKVLNVKNNGLVKVGGDWLNQGVFMPGTGMVEFYGANQGEIPTGVTPGNDLGNYSLSTFSAGMTNLTGATAGPTGDNAHSDVAIGFGFKYLGVTYTQVRINTNGWLSLDLSGDDATSGDNTRLFYNMTPYTVLAPWWDDLLDDATSVVSYKTEGIAPNRIFTVEWKDILAYSSVATARLNFQVKLYETSNVIEYCYGTVAAGIHSPLEGASIGINDGGGGGGRYIEASSGSMSNVITCLASDASWPTVNYRFTPPASTEREIFYKMKVSKNSGVRLLIKRDTQVTGTLP